MLGWGRTVQVFCECGPALVKFKDNDDRESSRTDPTDLF